VKNIIDTLDIKEGLSRDHGLTLAVLAENIAHEGAIFVEIGSWKGYSTSFLGEIAKKHGCHVYCVDHWQGSPGVYFHQLETDCFSKFQHNMKALGLSDYIHPLVMSSEQASKIFADGIADLIFIDGDHRYKPFAKDLDVWWPKVKEGGIFCGHDCEGYYFKDYTHEERKSIYYSELDWIENPPCHPGIVHGLYKKFIEYFDIENTVWYKTKERSL